MNANSPTRIGRYEIIRRLGKSMTDVYLAVDTIENRKAALKVVKTDGDDRTRMVLEAERRGAMLQKELRSLDSRVVEIYDVGDTDGYFFIAMQYVEGRSLSEVLRDEQNFDSRRAARVAYEVLEQLTKFHCCGTHHDGLRNTVVHGDIKPSNIHLGLNDTVRLLDFGIAKALRSGHDATVLQFGSPSYCSPERLRRSEVDQQSDLWAVASTLYEMIAGIPPYQAEDTQKLENVIQSGRPPRALPKHCPPALQAVLSKALAPNPQRRYHSAREFRDDLKAFLDHRATSAENGGRRFHKANTTIEVAKVRLAKATKTLARANAKPPVFSAVGWFLLGLTLWIGGSFVWQYNSTKHQIRAGDWHGWESLEHQYRLIDHLPPMQGLRMDLQKFYTAAAEDVIAAYRNSSDSDFRHFDWAKVRLSLDRLKMLGVNDDVLRGRMALADGYLALADPARKFSARDQFALAARYLPQSIDPHLGLARIYVEVFPDPDKSKAELQAAERLGFELSPRELEMQADAYRVRALQTESKEDALRARRLYQQIPGFGKADLHNASLEALLAPPPPPPAPVVKKKPRPAATRARAVPARRAVRTGGRRRR